jgi:hypothetical protein
MYMTAFRLIAAGLLLLGHPALSGQNFNRPVPKNVPPYDFVQYDSSYQGYYLTAPFRLGANTANASLPLMILDSKGFLFWYMPLAARNLLDFKFNSAAQLYQFVKFHNPQEVQYVLMDTGFNPVDSFTTVNGILPDIHDFQISSDHTFLLAGASDTILDLSAYLFNGTPGAANTRALGFVVQEFDADHNLLFQWNSNDHIHPGEAYANYPYSAAAFDYCHGNSIEEDTDGNLLLSFRNLNAVYKIDRHSGEILWQLGGKTSSFTFANDAGFSGQHDARRMPNGNIALFDNANQAAPPRISRAVEYQLDTLNWVATKVWEYQHAPGFFSPAMGCHQTTTDRRHLINYGLVFRPNPSVVLTDDDGKRLSELVFQDSFVIYRSYLFDLPLTGAQRPVISCAQNGGTVTLSAPAGYERYAWSTGETAASISVQAPGVYQLWVSHGAGMLGSEPFVIPDVSTACQASDVSETGGPDNSAPLEYFDLLGRKISPPEGPRTGSQLYVVRFADGRARLRLH